MIDENIAKKFREFPALNAKTGDEGDPQVVEVRRWSCYVPSQPARVFLLPGGLP